MELLEGPFESFEGLWGFEALRDDACKVTLHLAFRMRNGLAGRAQLVDSYVLLKNGEAWLLGARIEPLPSASTHFVTSPDRTRKLLLNQRELAKLFEGVQQEGHTAICTALYWKRHLVKCEIALAKGKKQHDKRETEKDRDWARQKQRLSRHAK